MARVGFVALALNGGVGVGHAAIYASFAAASAPRFASHRIDDSYKLFLADDPRRGSPIPDTRSPSPPPEHAALVTRRAEIDPWIRIAASRHRVEPALVRAVAEVESGFDSRASSNRGATGVMQLTPAIAMRYRGSTTLSPSENIDTGVAHLRRLLDRFDGNVVLALSAYNAGEGAVARHGNGIPKYRETMLYVPRVLAALHRYRRMEAGHE